MIRWFIVVITLSACLAQEEEPQTSETNHRLAEVRGIVKHILHEGDSHGHHHTSPHTSHHKNRYQHKNNYNSHYNNHDDQDDHPEIKGFTSYDELIEHLRLWHVAMIESPKYFGHPFNKQEDKRYIDNLFENMQHHGHNFGHNYDGHNYGHHYGH